MSTLFGKLYGAEVTEVQTAHAKATTTLVGVSKAQLETELKEVPYSKSPEPQERTELTSILKILTLDVIAGELSFEEAAIVFEAAHRGKEVWNVPNSSVDYKELGITTEDIFLTWFRILGSREHGVAVGVSFAGSLSDWTETLYIWVHLNRLLTKKVQAIWDKHHSAVVDTPVKDGKYGSRVSETVHQLDDLFKGLQPNSHMANYLREACQSVWLCKDGFGVAHQLDRDVLAQTHWLNPKALATSNRVAPIPVGVAFLRGMSSWMASVSSDTPGNQLLYVTLRDRFQLYWDRIKKDGWSGFLGSPLIAGDVEGYQTLQDFGKSKSGPYEVPQISIRQIRGLLSLGYEEVGSQSGLTPENLAEAWCEITQGSETGCGPAKDQYGEKASSLALAKYQVQKNNSDTLPQGLWEFLRGLCMKTALNNLSPREAIELWDKALELSTTGFTPYWVSDTADYGRRVCENPTSTGDLLLKAAEVWYELTLPVTDTHYYGKAGNGYINHLDGFVGETIAKRAWDSFKSKERVRTTIGDTTGVPNSVAGWIQYLADVASSQGYDPKLLQEVKEGVAKGVRKPLYPSKALTYSERTSRAWDWISFCHLPELHHMTQSSMLLRDLEDWVGTEALQEAKEKYIREGVNPKVKAMSVKQSENKPSVAVPVGKGILTPDEFGVLFGLSCALADDAISLTTAVEAFHKMISGELRQDAVREICDWPEFTEAGRGDATPESTLNRAIAWFTITGDDKVWKKTGSHFRDDLELWADKEIVEEAWVDYASPVGILPSKEEGLTEGQSRKSSFLRGLCISVSRGIITLDRARDLWGGEGEYLGDLIDLARKEPNPKGQEAKDLAKAWYDITLSKGLTTYPSGSFLETALDSWVGGDLALDVHREWVKKATQQKAPPKPQVDPSPVILKGENYRWYPAFNSPAGRSNPTRETYFFLRDLCLAVYDKKATLDEARDFWAHRSEGRPIWKKDPMDAPKKSRSSISLASIWYDIVQGETDERIHQEVSSWLGPDAARLGWDKMNRSKKSSGLTSYQVHYLRGLCTLLVTDNLKLGEGISMFCSTFDPKYAVEGEDQRIADLGASATTENPNKLAQMWFHIMGDPRVPHFEDYAKEHVEAWLGSRALEVGWNQYLDYGYTRAGWPMSARNFGDLVAETAHLKVLSGHLSIPEFKALYQRAWNENLPWASGFLDYAETRKNFSPSCHGVVTWAKTNVLISNPSSAVTYNQGDLAKVFRAQGGVNFNNIASELEHNPQKTTSHRFLGPRVGKNLTLTEEAAEWVRALVINLYNTDYRPIAKDGLVLLQEAITGDGLNHIFLERGINGKSEEEKIQLAYDWLSLFLHPDISPLVEDSLFTKDLVAWVGQDIATKASEKSLNNGPNPKIRALTLNPIVQKTITLNPSQVSQMRRLCLDLWGKEKTWEHSVLAVKELFATGNTRCGALVDLPVMSDTDLRFVAATWHALCEASDFKVSNGIEALGDWVGINIALDEHKTYHNHPALVPPVVKTEEPVATAMLSDSQVASIGYLCEAIQCRGSETEADVQNLVKILTKGSEHNFGPPVVKEGWSKSKEDLAGIWVHLFTHPSIVAITGGDRALDSLRSWLGEEATKLYVQGVPETPVRGTRTQNVLYALRTDAKEIALRTGVKRVRKAMGTLLVNFWTKQSNPRLETESLEDYNRRIEGLKPGVGGFFETEAGQGVLAYVTGFAWTMIHEEIPDGQLRDYGSLVARELRVQGGTDIFDGFVTEVMFPMLTTMKVLAGSLVSNAFLHPQVRVVGGNETHVDQGPTATERTPEEVEAIPGLIPGLHRVQGG